MNYVARSSVLVVEDELLIAIDLEQMLADLGFVGIVSKPSNSEAEEWLAAHTPSFAILDINLRDGSCETVAEELVKRSVPFLVSTGLETVAKNGIFAHGTFLPKPCQPEQLASALNDLGISAVSNI